MRYILHHVMIKPFAVFAMNLKYPPAGYDKEFRVSDADLEFGRWMAADKAKVHLTTDYELYLKPVTTSSEFCLQQTFAEELLKEASQPEEMARIKNEIEKNQDLADKIIHQVCASQLHATSFPCVTGCAFPCIAGCSSPCVAGCAFPCVTGCALNTSSNRR